MVTITGEDGKRTEYIVVDGDGSWEIRSDIQNMDEPAFSEAMGEKRTIKINKNEMSVDQVRMRFGDRVASILSDRL